MLSISLMVELFWAISLTNMRDKGRGEKKRLGASTTGCEYKEFARKLAKKEHVLLQQQNDSTRQCESGDTNACSPRWVSGFYNWTLLHQWCCSTEESRHLYTPVGIHVIASHL